MCLRLEPQGKLQWQSRAILRINCGPAPGQGPASSFYKSLLRLTPVYRLFTAFLPRRGSQGLRRRMRCFIGANFGVMLQREADIVEPVQQAVSYKFVDGKLGVESQVVTDFTLFQIDSDLVVVD